MDINLHITVSVTAPDGKRGDWVKSAITDALKLVHGDEKWAESNLELRLADILTFGQEHLNRIPITPEQIKVTIQQMKDLNPPQTPIGFCLVIRNPGHWDIMKDGKRIYRIRGEKGRVLLFNEVDHGDPFPFNSIADCMALLVGALMPEGR